LASQIFTDLPVNLLVFVLSTFLGIGLISHVSRLLHTPLMSLTNAISSVSIVAALIVMSETTNTIILSLAVVGVGLAFTNIVSGFLITERILRMFRPQSKVKETEKNAKN
jgi:H+-translocating NAD(P) transhydrogenase subunit alpha